MDALIPIGLVRPLSLADLGLAEAAAPENVRAACDDFSAFVTNKYLSGDLSWKDADQVINNIYEIMITRCGDRVPDFAWDVYLAFDTAECTAPGGDSVTRPLLMKALERMPNNRWRGP